MPNDAVHVYLGIGSNLGDRLANLRAAVHAIAATTSISLNPTGDLAPVYETSPVDAKSGDPPFLNTVVRITTDLAPHALLRVTMAIEGAMGRVRRQKNEPRTIDIDILLYGDLVLSDGAMTLPHPRMHERRFVLEPLVALAPHLIHPVLRRSIRSLADQARAEYPNDSVNLIAGRNWYAADPAQA